MRSAASATNSDSYEGNSSKNSGVVEPLPRPSQIETTATIRSRALSATAWKRLRKEKGKNSSSGKWALVSDEEQRLQSLKKQKLYSSSNSSRGAGSRLPPVPHTNLTCFPHMFYWHVFVFCLCACGQAWIVNANRHGTLQGS